MGSRKSALSWTSFACGLLALWVAASPTHNHETSFLPWAVGKNVSSKVKGHQPGFYSIVTKTTEIKLGDHQEITHDMVLKPHKTHRLHIL